MADIVKARILCVGEKMPIWVEQACTDYMKRLHKHFELELKEIPLLKRSKSNLAQILKKESQAILSVVHEQDHVVALDILGKSCDTPKLALRLQSWQLLAKPLSFVIGGPEGLHQDVLMRADERWSLSPLTLPHPLVRIILLEQLYRAWSILHHHPYHRE